MSSWLSRPRQQRLPLRIQLGMQLRDRVREFLDSFCLERLDYVVVVDADGLELFQQAVGLVESALERRRDRPVVLKGEQRRFWRGKPRVVSR